MRLGARLLPVTVLALSLLGGSVAAASPLVANRQASNDATEIAYDDISATFEVLTDTSAIRIPEKIRMWADITSDPAAEAGSRLLGNLRIYLRGDRAMSFDGIFKIVLLNSVTEERTAFEVSDAFVLRPKAGMRGHRVDYVFDMPTGTYLYFGRYKPGV